MTSYIREQGAALARMGYPVIPIAPGKKACLAPNWPNMVMTADECASYAPDYGVGIICGRMPYPIVGIDADIDGNEALADIIYARWTDVFPFLRNSFKRIGKHPKFLLMAVTDKPIGYDGTKEFTKSGFPKIELEILGKGHQFVAYHTHPDTKLPYTWYGPEDGKDPTNVPPSDLLPITCEQLNTLKEIFIEEAVKAGYTSAAPQSRIVEVDSDEAWTTVSPKMPPLAINSDLVREIIEDLAKEGKINNMDRNGEFGWLDVGMRLHHQFRGMPEGLDIWDEFSQSAEGKYKGYDDLARTYASFGSYSGNEKTFSPLYKAWQSLEKNQNLALNETGLMYRVDRYMEGRLKFPVEIATFREYSNGRWGDIGEPRIRRVILSVVEKMLPEEMVKAEAAGDLERKQGLMKFKTQIECGLSRFSSSVYKDLQGFVNCSIKDFDADPGVIAVGNGVVRLNGRHFEPARPEQMITRGSDVLYDGAARSLLWEKTIDEIFQGDKEVTRYFQKAVGYALSGDPVEHQSFFLVGNGHNGKSLVLKVLENVFGSYSQSIRADYFTEKGKGGGANSGGADPILMSLIGRRLAICSETEEGARMKDATLKRLVSQDTLTGRQLYSGSIIRLEPTWVMFVATNVFPETNATDNGFWRRIRRINFNANFSPDDPKTDKYLPQKLTKPTELSGILNWCLDGYDLYKSEGLAPPETVKKTMAELRSEADVTTPWIEECCVVEEGAEAKVQDLFESWTTYAMRARCFDRYKTKKALSQCLMRRFESKHKSQGNYFLGIRLKTEYDTEFENQLQKYF